MGKESNIRKFGWITFSVVAHTAVIMMATMLPANSVEHNPLEAIEVVEQPASPSTPAPVETAADEPPPPPTPRSAVHKIAKAAPAAVAPAPKAAIVDATPTRVKDVAPVESDTSDVAMESADEDEPEEKAPAPKPTPVPVAVVAKAEPVVATAEATDDDGADEDDNAEAPEATSAPVVVAPVVAGAPKIAMNETPKASGTGNAEKLRPSTSVVNKAPMYPDTDRKAHREGDVRVRFFVNADGQVGRSQLLNNSGSKDMADSALGALKGYRYDSNQAGWWEKTFHFSLNGNGEVYGGQLRR